MIHRCPLCGNESTTGHACVRPFPVEEKDLLRGGPVIQLAQGEIIDGLRADLARQREVLERLVSAIDGDPSLPYYLKYDTALAAAREELERSKP